MPSVRSLHTYPVKSLAGQEVDVLELDQRGCRGDRFWSVRTPEGKIGSGKETRRFAAVPGLLTLRAETVGDRVAVVLPDGRRFHTDDPDAAGVLSAHLGRPLSFARETDVSHFDDGPVSLLGTASVSAVAAELGTPVHPSRFRPNVVVRTDEPYVEQTWVGRRVRVGGAVLDVLLASPRCVMVNAQTCDLPALPGHLAAIGRVNDATLGVVARVVTPASIRAGDQVELL